MDGAPLASDSGFVAAARCGQRLERTGLGVTPFEHALQPLAQVLAAGLLVGAEAELRHHRQQVVEHVALDALVVDPGGGAGEAVYLQRDALGGRLQLADHAGHVRMDVRMVLQVGEGVGAERTDVGQPAAVGGQRGDPAVGGIPLLQLGLLAGHVFGEQAHLAQAPLFLLVEETHLAGVDVDRPLDPPSAGLLHAAPLQPVNFHTI